MAAGPSCSMPARQSAEYYYDRFVDKCSALGVSASEETLSILKESFVHGELHVPSLDLSQSCATALAEIVAVCDSIKYANVSGRVSQPAHIPLCLALLHGRSQDSLRTVQFCNRRISKRLLKDLLSSQLRSCTSMRLSKCRIKKLEQFRGFSSLTVLILDDNPSLTYLPSGCFSGCPKLQRLSLCNSGISNLWTTCSCLKPLKALRELSFQKLVQPQCQPWFGLPLTDYLDASLEEFDSMPCDSTGDRRTPTDELRTMVPAAEALSSGGHDRSMRSDAHVGSAQAALRRGSSMTDAVLDNLYSGEDEADSFSDSSSLSSEEDVYMEDADSSDPDDELWEDSAGDRTLSGSTSSYRNGWRGVDGYRVGPEFGQDPVSGDAPLVGKEFASPICKQKHYRLFVRVQLPQLEKLDSCQLPGDDAQQALEEYNKYFEPFQDTASKQPNVVRAIAMREIGGWGRRTAAKRSNHLDDMAGRCRGRGLADVSCNPNLYQDNQRGSRAHGANIVPRQRHRHTTTQSAQFPRINRFCCQQFRKQMCEAAYTQCRWPLVTQLNSVRNQPRQFEYHPTQAERLVYGTMQGELVVMNHETDQLIGNVKSTGAPHSILGISWLHHDPSKLVAGSDHGIINLYDVNRMAPPPVQEGTSSVRSSDLPDGGYTHQTRSPIVYTYDEFENLTSVHINCTDEYFLASGYSHHVGLYDLRTGRRRALFKNLHREHINVLKFANHSPHVFATSSFDRDIKVWDIRQPLSRPLSKATSKQGNVMVCFSHDDYHLLASAVDNEVKQYVASDGRLDLQFDIDPTGSLHNYTRSYYLSGQSGGYVISGSCEENCVRVCCARTGRRLRSVTLEGSGMKGSLYVQSLRGEPCYDFHFGVLVAYNDGSSRSEIVKVNLLSSLMDEDPNEENVDHNCNVSCSALGG
mmetsp:Transcript_3998/g.14223  ORF Transcript_3998/g.14223 Transcript_3998/m.14223 type:complete len:917 (+) Transcript_3998:222-2972(+)